MSGPPKTPPFPYPVPLLTLRAERHGFPTPLSISWKSPAHNRPRPDFHLLRPRILMRRLQQAASLRHPLPHRSPDQTAPCGTSAYIITPDRLRLSSPEVAAPMTFSLLDYSFSFLPPPTRWY